MTSDEVIALLTSTAARIHKRKTLARQYLRYAKMVQDCPAGERREAVAAAVIILLDANERNWTAQLPMGDMTQRVRAAVPWVSPHVGPHWVARLVLGESPAQITGLPRKWATAFFQGSDRKPSESPAAWYLRILGYPDFAVRDVLVALWLVERLRKPDQQEALTRHRKARGPHGELIEGSYLDRVDELQASDLRSSVEDTFQAAAERLKRELERTLARKRERLAPPPAWWVPMRCARLLLTGGELVVEGRLQNHCVGTYANYVRQRQSVIVALDVLGHRSTVELDIYGHVRQHMGRGNSEPPELCARALQVLLRRITERKRELNR